MVFHPKKSIRSAIAAVEFAVCLPVIVLVVVGLLEVGRIVEITQILTNAAREAARNASTGLLPIPTISSSSTVTALSSSPISTAAWPTTAYIPQVVLGTAPNFVQTGSTATSPVSSIAYQTVVYLQTQQYKTIGQAFGATHATTIAQNSSATSPLPSTFNNASYTVKNSDTGAEIFTIGFYDMTTPAVYDPYGIYTWGSSSFAKGDQFQIGLQVPYSSVALSPIPQITGMGRLSVILTWSGMVDSQFPLSPTLPAY